MSRAPDPTRIVVADEEALFRLAVCDTARALFPQSQVREARSYGELLSALREQPELVVLDPALPGMNGYLSLLALHQRNPKIRFIALSGLDTPGAAPRALATGLVDYVSKRATPEQIRRVLARAPRRAASPARALRQLPPRERRVMAGMRELTPAELAVFALLPDNPSHRHLMQALGIALPTVKTHMSRILDKLKLRNRTAAAVLANRLTSLESPVAPSPRSRRYPAPCGSAGPRPRAASGE